MRLMKRINLKIANKNNFKILNLIHFQRVILSQIILNKMNNLYMNRLIKIQTKILTNLNQYYKIIINFPMIANN
jgi:hypothetical protein